MSDPQRPGGRPPLPPDVPPDVPPEYADAYLAGFRRAYDEGMAAALPGADESGVPSEDEETVHESSPEWELDVPDEPAEDPRQDWGNDGGEPIPELDSWESDDETRDDFPELVPGFQRHDGGSTRALPAPPVPGHRVPWAALALVVVLAALLIAGAFLLGKALADTGSEAAPTPRVEVRASARP